MTGEKKGKLYGVGTGPGDSELMTLKAARLIRECDGIVLPDSGKKNVAYEIAAGAVPEIEEKEKIRVSMPMTRDRKRLEEAHRKGAETICAALERGMNLVFVTLGDPCIYSTYWHVHRIVEAKGYPCEIVPGVPSFCAAAARLGEGLAESDQGIYIMPGSYGDIEMGLDVPGTKVIMKSGKSMGEVLEKVRGRNEENVFMVERCSMEGEKIYRSAEEIGETEEYFSILIVK